LRQTAHFPKGLKHCFRVFYDELANGNDYHVQTVYAHFHQGLKPPGKKLIAIRHDVDIALGLVLSLAEFEANLGFSSTYYFLTDTAPYRIWESDVPRQLVKLGHEVGLHSDHNYEQVALRRDGLQRLRDDVRRLGDQCGEPIRGVVWHGGKHLPPLGITNYDLYADLPATALGLEYHDSALYQPGTRKWRTTKLLSDGENNLRFVPGKPRRVLRSLKPGDDLLFVGHPFMMFNQGFRHPMKYPAYPHLSPPRSRTLLMDLKSLLAYNKADLKPWQQRFVRWTVRQLEKRLPS
jgi:hypothetical protein